MVAYAWGSLLFRVGTLTLVVTIRRANLLENVDDVDDPSSPYDDTFGVMAAVFQLTIIPWIIFTIFAHRTMARFLRVIPLSSLTVMGLHTMTPE